MQTTTFETKIGLFLVIEKIKSSELIPFDTSFSVIKR